MNCNDAYIFINLFIDEALPKEDLQHLEEHLLDCPECSQSLNQMKEINKLLTEEEVPIPLDLTESILSQISINSLMEKYSENKKLKFILILESIAFIVVMILSYPQLSKNINDISNYFCIFFSDFKSYSYDLSLTTHMINSYFENLSLTPFSYTILIIIFVVCVVYNLALYYKLRSKEI